jgi:hypothetical protein
VPAAIYKGKRRRSVQRAFVRLNERMSSVAITVYGVCAVSFMMAMYALERKGKQFVILFALGCLLSSAYGFLSGAWPFGVVELIWSGVAVRRWSGAGGTARSSGSEV